VALGVLRAAYERKIAIPAQLSVVSYDDVPYAPYACPALTTVAPANLTRGRTAAELLLELIQGETPPAPAPIPVRLVVRETTGPVSA
jgi:LacI family transcriptional regulator